MDETLLLGFRDVEDEHWWFAVRRQIVLHALASTNPPPGAAIAEVGCGTGGTLQELARRYPASSVKGIEPNRAAAERASSVAAVSVGFFEALPLADESVDVLLSLDVLEHCQDDAKAAREAWRVLRRGGVWISTVPALPWLWGPHDDLNEHRRRYVKRTLTAVVTDAGFSIERLGYFNSLLLPLGWASRLVARVLPSRPSLGVGLPPRPVNALLRSIFSLERPLIRRDLLPVGMSLLAVTRKEAD